jgi:hypothetical protein
VYRYEKVSSKCDGRPLSLEISGTFDDGKQLFSIAPVTTTAVLVMAKNIPSSKKKPEERSLSAATATGTKTVVTPVTPATVTWSGLSQPYPNLPRYMVHTAYLMGHRSVDEMVTVEALEESNLPLDRALGCPCRDPTGQFVSRHLDDSFIAEGLLCTVHLPTDCFCVFYSVGLYGGSRAKDLYTTRALSAPTTWMILMVHTAIMTRSTNSYWHLRIIPLSQRRWLAQSLRVATCQLRNPATPVKLFSAWC